MKVQDFYSKLHEYTEAGTLEWVQHTNQLRGAFVVVSAHGKDYSIQVAEKIKEDKSTSIELLVLQQGGQKGALMLHVNEDFSRETFELITASALKHFENNLGTIFKAMKGEKEVPMAAVEGGKPKAEA